MANEDDDNIPTLNDVLRPGDGTPGRRSGEASNTDRDHDDSPLTAAEIEAIAHRVIENYTRHLQKAITKAIDEAIDAKNRERQSGRGDTDGNQD